MVVVIIVSVSLYINIANVSAYLTDLSSIPSVGQSMCPERVLWQNG